MEKELEGLKENLIKVLETRGLNLVAIINNETILRYALDDSFKKTYGETTINQFSGKPYTPSYINGLCIELEETYNHNGATHNHSFNLFIMQWKDNCGKVLGKVKIYENFSNNKQIKLANEIIDKFIELTKVSA